MSFSVSCWVVGWGPGSFVARPGPRADLWGTRHKTMRTAAQPTC
nr:MAG TPA: hypothetical protein [Caudoviricetes sp.]